ncbi:unnamed protein product [Phaeothamnion confervicola]
MQLIFVNLLPQINVLSYAGCVSANFVLDPEDVPNSAMLSHFFSEELAALCAGLGLPPPPPLSPTPPPLPPLSA